MSFHVFALDDAFADWFKQAHANRPAPPPEFSSTSHGARGFTQRLQADEAKKTYEARVERWRHELRLDTEVAAEKLLQLLTYPFPGWMVDVGDNSDTTNAVNKSTTSTRGDCELHSSPHAVQGDNAVEEEDEDDMNAVGATGDIDGQPDASNSMDVNDPSSALVDLGENSEARRLQMQVLRETCLTETCFLLVRLYQTAGMHDQCLELIDLIASEERGLHKLEANGLIVQLVRLRNIAIPQADEEFGTAQGQGIPRLFRLSLTDGKNTISALDVDNHERLRCFSDTLPGTKLRLLNTIPISNGFLILRKDRFQVLGGNVINLVNEWTLTKQAKVTQGRLKTGEGGPPPFVPFGSQEAIALVQSENRFLLSLRRNRGQGDGTSCQ
ncbi:Ubiquitin associated translation elongation factor EF1B [Fasciolopsis buskii]|uniref:Nuclear pore complex protein n=1 Tax=Fasciolopsis buskii TaxID=27845 RepID=A0A8E0S675_9TREM|nr:Ubiquitin associated translation elongation factor EF1B [Fasciolopsis buski]